MAQFDDTYDQLKIEKLKLTLQRQSEAGQPRYYEIYVDGLKAVSKTNDITEFDQYENFMTEDTQKVRILLYTTHINSPRNDQFTYKVARKQEQAPVNASLSGIEIEAKIDEKMKQERQRWQHDMLRKELEQTKRQLQEAEEYAEKLEAELAVYRGKKMQWGNVNLGELASVVVEGFVRRNPQMLSKLPGGDALAGIIEQDNKEQGNRTLSNQQQDSEVSFKKKENNEQETEGIVLTEEEKGYLQFMRGIAESFEDEEIVILTQIITSLEADTTQLRPVAELLNIPVEKTAQTTKGSD